MNGWPLLTHQPDQKLTERKWEEMRIMRENKDSGNKRRKTKNDKKIDKYKRDE